MTNHCQLIEVILLILCKTALNKIILHEINIFIIDLSIKSEKYGKNHHWKQSFGIFILKIT